MTWNIDIENIAGIHRGTATLEPGVNAVKGSNWQGKSSFVDAIKTALGTATTLTEGKDRGAVHLETPDRAISVELTAENGDVRRSGSPYLTDEYDVVRAQLFACLDEQNEIRKAVREGISLEDVLLRPLDFQNIDERVATLQREREQVESERAQAREAAKRLPGVERRLDTLTDELETLREKRDSLIAAGTDEADSPESIQQELSEARSERSRAESQVERLTQAIEQTETKIEEREAELDSLTVDVDESIEEQLATARENLQKVKSTIEVLQTVYSANEMVLSEGQVAVLTDVERELSGDTITCWTCGSEQSKDAFERRLELLSDRITEYRVEAESYRDDVEELEARREEFTQAQKRKETLERDLESLRETLADRTQRLESAADRLAVASERVENLSEMADETVAERTDIESEIKYREAELKDVRSEKQELEQRSARLDDLDTTRDEIQAEIETLKNRKTKIKRELREEFAKRITEISDQFETGFESARLTSQFELVVARDGREVSLEALSEGERELIGVIVALAGHVSFEVDQIVPVLLLDGIGALADENLQALITYLDDRVSYLVFTTYPEHSTPDGQVIDPTRWKIAGKPSE